MANTKSTKAQRRAFNARTMKVTPSKVRRIKYMRSFGTLQCIIAEAVGISQTLVSYVLSGKYDDVKD